MATAAPALSAPAAVEIEIISIMNSNVSIRHGDEPPAANQCTRGPICICGRPWPGILTLHDFDTYLCEKMIYTVRTKSGLRLRIITAAKYRFSLHFSENLCQSAANPPIMQFADLFPGCAVPAGRRIASVWLAARVTPPAERASCCCSLCL